MHAYLQFYAKYSYQISDITNKKLKFMKRIRDPKFSLADIQSVIIILSLLMKVTLCSRI